MTNEDFFRSRLEQMIDLRHPLAVLAQRMPWTQIETALAPAFQHREREGQVVESEDLFGPNLQVVGAGISEGQGVSSHIPTYPAHPGFPRLGV
jgi:transposase, IS5 family